MRVGIDIIEINRFNDMSKDISKLSKIFTQNEIDYFKKYNFDCSHIAGCFCAKESFVKAIKTGFNKDIVPLSIEILHNEENGSPFYNVCQFLKEKFFINGIDLSISHDKTQATAICIIN